MSERADSPFIVVTAILDGSARSAQITVSHGDAMEKAINATVGREIAGLDIIELPVAPPAFNALRVMTGRSAESVAVYDVFPLSPALAPNVRTVAGQFLAAEALWTLEEQGHLKGVPLNLKLDVPKGWERDPKAIHEKLVGAGALELSPKAIETFKSIKSAWDETAASL